MLEFPDPTTPGRRAASIGSKAVLLALLVCALLTALGVSLAWHHGAHASPAAAVTPTVIATVSVGANPLDVDINPYTKGIYVANHGSNTVSVVDGTNNMPEATIQVGDHPHRLAVDSVTNRIYIANWMSSSLSVIDGSSNKVLQTITSGLSYPWGVAVNPNTNRIYVTNRGLNNVAAIDGATNSLLTSVNVGSLPHGIAVNSTSNRIYATNEGSDSVSVIDGATNHLLDTVPVGHLPYGDAVNPITNRIYVANYGSNSVSVIDGATDAVSYISVGVQPKRVAVNTSANRIYVANSGENSVSIVDGATNQVVGTFAVGQAPDGIAVDSMTNRIYVTNANNTLWVMEDQAASPPIARAVVFIQGIDSQSRAGQSPVGCSTTQGFLNSDGTQRASWIANYLSDPTHVGGLALQRDKNFFYFSYSGQYCLDDNGMQDFRRPIYAPTDTCGGVGDAAGKLQTVLAALITRYPGVKFDLVAHSMGGMVAAYWLTQHGNDQTAQGPMKDYINSLTTFDSPLKGVPNANVFTSACDVTGQSWQDLICTSTKCSPIVGAIKDVGTQMNVFTIDATSDDLPLIQFVPSDRTTLLNSNSVLHCGFTDTHSSVWASATPIAPLTSCWSGFHWTDNPPEPTLRDSDENSKGAFVACAVAGLSGSQCMDKIGQPYQPPVVLPGPSPAGSTELPVANGAFSVGDDIVINPGMPNEESNKVVGLGSIILASPLQFDHQAGEPIAIVGSPAVGGIAELPDAHADAAATKSSQSAPRTLPIAGLAAGSALLVVAGGWYFRRRWPGRR